VLPYNKFTPYQPCATRFTCWSRKSFYKTGWL
jgi:hypothetical protein